MNDILEMMIGAAQDEAAGKSAREKGGLPALSSTACSCHAEVQETLVTEKVPIGEDGDFFEVEVPILHCLECGLSFRDHRSEQLRHAAACRHDGLLTPKEVKAVRTNLGMSQKAFAEAFAIPPASMDRWEHGRLMQNASMNMLLRALMMPGVAAALDRRQKASTNTARPDNIIYVNFGALAKRSAEERGETLERSLSFDLRAFG